jgi:multidrug efflux pump
VTTIALLVSWVVSVLFVPYLGYKLLPISARGVPMSTSMPSTANLLSRFRSLVEWCVGRRWLVIGATVGAFVLAVVRFQVRAAAVLPSASRPELIVDLLFPRARRSTRPKRR